MTERRKMIAVIGYAHLEEDSPAYREAQALGKALVGHGFRVVTGGLGGVMEAALRGAKCAESYREGDTVALLPSFDTSAANGYADIVIATGTDVYRNAMVANADAVIAIGGGAGTLSELSYAWHLCRLIAVYRQFGGWAASLADQVLDGRERCTDGDDRLFGVSSAAEVLALLDERLGKYTLRPPKLA